MKLRQLTTDEARIAIKLRLPKLFACVDNNAYELEHDAAAGNEMHPWIVDYHDAVISWPDEPQFPKWIWGGASDIYLFFVEE